jgi:hypothetical protein
MADVTRKEWVNLLYAALTPAPAWVKVSAGHGRTLGVDAEEAWITAHLEGVIDISVGLAPVSVQEGVLRAEVRVGSSSSLPSNITAARAHVDAAAQTISFAEHVYTRLFRYRVWLHDAPCGACSGRGWQGHAGNPCLRCGGLGVRNDR